MDALIHRTDLGMDRRPGMETPVRSAISVVACTLLSCSALFLVVRLLMDRFEYRLENHALLMLVFTLCIFSFFCRYNYLRSDLIYRGLFPGMHVWLDYGPVVAVFCCFVVLTISGMPGVWLGAGTAGLMMVEWMLRRPWSIRLSKIFQKPNKAGIGMSTSGVFQPARLNRKRVKSIRTQQQRHRKLDNGQECWEGWIRIRVPANTRHLVEHISFCPSFPRPPELECFLLSEAPVRVKVAHVVPFGARVELHMTHTVDTSTDVAFAFVATSSSLRPE